MWYPSTVKTPAADPPVSIEAARRQCGLATNDTSQDGQLGLLLAAAAAHVEQYCCIRLAQQVVVAPCDAFADLCRLPEAPVSEVVAITYVDGEGLDQTLNPAVYEARLDGLQPAIVLAFGHSWPAPRLGSRIMVELAVGYAALPKNIEAAVLLLVASHFTFARRDLLKRSEEVEGVGSTQWSGAIEVTQAMRTSVDMLLANFRNWPL